MATDQEVGSRAVGKCSLDDEAHAVAAPINLEAAKRLDYDDGIVPSGARPG
jgi:hypothetical protein